MAIDRTGKTIGKTNGIHKSIQKEWRNGGRQGKRIDHKNIFRRDDEEGDRESETGKEEPIIMNPIRRIGEGIQADNRPLIGRPEIG